MKYAIGNRLNFVQIDSQFSNEMEDLISKYAGININKYHKILSVIYQIHMHAGNSGGYFLPASQNDIEREAVKLKLRTDELKTIYDMATRCDVFDRQQYEKNHIITNYTLQISFLQTKYRNTTWSMDANHILDSTYNFFKSDSKYLKIVSKLDEIVNKFKSIEPNGIEQKGNVLNQDDDDMTLEEFKKLYPKKCFTLPEDWIKPAGVKLQLISEAIKNSQKFLEVKNYMTLERLSTEFYKKVCSGFYDDSNYDVNIVKNEQKKTQNYSNRDYSNVDLNSLFGDLSKVEL